MYLIVWNDQLSNPITGIATDNIKTVVSFWLRNLEKFRSKELQLFCKYFLVAVLKRSFLCFWSVTYYFLPLGCLNVQLHLFCFVVFFVCVRIPDLRLWHNHPIDQALRIISCSSRPGSALWDKVNCLVVFLTGAISCALNIWAGLKAIDLPHRPWTKQTCGRWPSLNHNASRIILKTPTVAKWLLQNVVLYFIFYFFARQQNL